MFLDAEVKNASQVSKKWRRAILRTGDVRRRINRLEESKSEKKTREILASELSTNQFGQPIDEITVLCYTKRLERSGVVYGWGSNKRGQLIVRNLTETLPTEITEFGTVTDVAAGHLTSFAAKDAELFAVGSNHFGQLGLGILEKVPRVPSKLDLPIRVLIGVLGRNYSSSVDVHLSPQMIKSIEDYEIKQVDCGFFHASCLSTDGEVFTWGQRNLVGQGPLESDITVPTKLQIEKISQISCGDYHTLLLSADQKTVLAFGRNSFGQLGHARHGIAETPVKVPFLGEKAIVKIQCCAYDSAILSADGEITVWGETWNGGSPATPRLVNLRQVVDISMGNGFMLALTSSNRLYAFGKNSDGQCGQGWTSDFIEEPVEVKNLENVRIKQISAGADHCLIKCVKL